ncbi:thioredoxin family protein [Glaciecola sp. 1036]|uniref:thioredoxin family protein n=1 Tax=Alteromonadaceae TaxID=72275 RepID=UPI003D0353AA
MSRFILLFIIATLSSALSADDKNIVLLDDYKYTPSSDAVEKLQQVITTGKTENKLVLAVFGAQWCHDSRALSETFSIPDFHSQLQDKFAVQFVDVGYLENRSEALSELNLIGFYGTPTVVIFDPVNNKVLNRQDHVDWTNAASKDYSAFEEYFLSDKFKIQSDAETLNPNQQKKMNTIKAFEQIQAKRLKRAYQKLSPLLKSYKENPEQDHEEFYAVWREVRQFRIQLDSDIVGLIDSVKSAPEESITFPTYPSFSWE